MAVQAYFISDELRPPWTKNEYKGAWIELVIDTPKEYVKFVAMVDRLFGNQPGQDFTIEQARPFSEWPRVYYLGLVQSPNVLAFKLAINEIDHSAADELR
jgi:hypothetical protein